MTKYDNPSSQSIPPEHKRRSFDRRSVAISVLAGSVLTAAAFIGVPKGVDMFSHEEIGTGTAIVYNGDGAAAPVARAYQDFLDSVDDRDDTGELKFDPDTVDGATINTGAEGLGTIHPGDRIRISVGKNGLGDILITSENLGSVDPAYIPEITKSEADTFED